MSDGSGNKQLKIAKAIMTKRKRLLEWLRWAKQPQQELVLVTDEEAQQKWRDALQRAMLKAKEQDK